MLSFNPSSRIEYEVNPSIFPIGLEPPEGCAFPVFLITKHRLEFQWYDVPVRVRRQFINQIGGYALLQPEFGEALYHLPDLRTDHDKLPDVEQLEVFDPGRQVNI